MNLSVVIDSVAPEVITDFWATGLGYLVHSRLGQYVVLVPERPDGAPRDGRPVLVLQRVPEPRAGKNRVHLDVHPPDVLAHVAALERLGGTRVGPPVTDLLESAGIWWQPMADPEGNLLCVVADPGHPDPPRLTERAARDTVTRRGQSGRRNSSPRLQVERRHAFGQVRQVRGDDDLGQPGVGQPHGRALLGQPARTRSWAPRRGRVSPAEEVGRDADH